jgi:hypothetical protein
MDNRKTFLAKAMKEEKCFRSAAKTLATATNTNH